MKKDLQGKKILITAGPTWVPIDKLRVITNIFKGTLGLVIAQKAQSMGAKVVVLLGPSPIQLSKKNKNLKIINFKFFDELLKLMKEEISSKKYDAVIHSAAVADYTPVKIYDGKIKSTKKRLVIVLKPTMKIVNLIRDWDPSIFLVKFKLEIGLSKKELIDVAYKSMIFSKADLVVANNLDHMVGNKYIGFIVDKNKMVKGFNQKEKLASALIKIIKKNL